MELLRRLLILKWHPRKRKIAVPRLKTIHYYYLKTQDDALFKNRSKLPDFVLRPLKFMLNLEVDRLSLQQLEYEMDCTDYPADYNFFKSLVLGLMNTFQLLGYTVLTTLFRSTIKTP